MKIEEILSQREITVLKMVAEGKTGVEIGEHLGISPKTVEQHRHHIYQKAGVSNTAELVHMAISSGMVKLMRRGEIAKTKAAMEALAELTEEVQEA